jgi:hypothetical protein
MSAITNHLILDLIKRHYRPYDTHEEFRRGFSAYQAGNFRNPHRADSISAQAWDHGVEAAMHYVESLEARSAELASRRDLGTV